MSNVKKKLQMGCLKNMELDLEHQLIGMWKLHGKSCQHKRPTIYDSLMKGGAYSFGTIVHLCGK